MDEATVEYPSHGMTEGIDDVLRALIVRLSHRVVVVGSVACGETFPKDLDLLFDFDNDAAYAEVKNIVGQSGLAFESMCPGSWSFSDYGFPVEILPVHYGPSYGTCRRRAQKRKIVGCELLVAQPHHCPREHRRADEYEPKHG